MHQFLLKILQPVLSWVYKNFVRHEVWTGQPDYIQQKSWNNKNKNHLEDIENSTFKATSANGNG